MGGVGGGRTLMTAKSLRPRHLDHWLSPLSVSPDLNKWSPPSTVGSERTKNRRLSPTAFLQYLGTKGTH